MQDSLFTYAGLAPRVCRTCSWRMQVSLFAYVELALRVCSTCSSHMKCSLVKTRLCIFAPRVFRTSSTPFRSSLLFKCSDSLFAHAGLALRVCRTRSSRMRNTLFASSDLALAYAGRALCACRTRSSQMQDSLLAYAGPPLGVGRSRSSRM